jgi:hypothetical protein
LSSLNTFVLVLAAVETAGTWLVVTLGLTGAAPDVVWEAQPARQKVPMQKITANVFVFIGIV